MLNNLGIGDLLLLPFPFPSEFQKCLYLDHFPLLQHSSNTFNKANFIFSWQIGDLILLGIQSRKRLRHFPSYVKFSAMDQKCCEGKEPLWSCCFPKYPFHEILCSDQTKQGILQEVWLIKNLNSAAKFADPSSWEEII